MKKPPGLGCGLTTKPKPRGFTFLAAPRMNCVQ
jgi:hypothetical protein